MSKEQSFFGKLIDDLALVATIGGALGAVMILGTCLPVGGTSTSASSNTSWGWFGSNGVAHAAGATLFSGRWAEWGMHAVIVPLIMSLRCVDIAMFEPYELSKASKLGE